MTYVSFIEKFKNIIIQKPNDCCFIDNENKRMTWVEYYLQCMSFALGLKDFNVGRDECVAIMGFNHPKWFISAVGSSFYGVPFTGIYPTNGPDEVDHNLKLSNASVLVIENVTLLEKIKIKHPLKLILVYNEEVNVSTYITIPIFSFTPFIEKNKKFNGKINENEELCYIFTSGTTGKSKAVIITNENVSFTADRMSKIYGLKDERVISYLPLSHIAAGIIDIFCHFYHQGIVIFAKPDALKGSLIETLKKNEPTIFFGVPRVWEKIKEGMIKQANEKYRGKIGKIIRMIMTYVKMKTKNVHNHYQNNQRANIIDYIIFSIFKPLLFEKIKRELGLRKCKYFMTGAAPISKDVIEYFASINIIINELYGMSETTGVITASLPNQYRWGSSGKPFIGEIKIGDDGEILYKSKCVCKGYKNNEEETNKLIKDGWLHTGDIGEVKEGYLYITGRKKELVITAGGENVAPVKIEERIKENCNMISNVVIIGDKRKYLTCLITLQLKEKSNELIYPKYGVKTIENVLLSKEWMEEINNAVEKYNRNPISNAQKIQKFTILKEDFTIENNCITPTMKLKRANIHKRFEQEIEKMY